MTFTIAAVMAGLFALGGAVGALLHARIMAVAAASKADVAGWLLRLRYAIASEEAAAKEKLRELAADIEKKL